MMRKDFFFGLSLLLGMVAFPLLAQQAVLYTGSDWCDADVALRQIWEQPSFRAEAGMQLAIVDEPEVVTDAVKAEWEAMKGIRFELENYPGVAVFDAEGRCVLLRQGLAWDTSKEDLIAVVREGEARAEQVHQLLAQETVEGAAAAIQLLQPEFDLRRSRQENVLKVAWDQLKRLDPKDESGVVAALNFNPLETIYQVHTFAEKKDYAAGEAYIAQLLSPVAQARLTVNQRQGLRLHTYVLYRNVEERREQNIALLREVVEMDPTTHFGQGALGRLKHIGAVKEVPSCRPEPVALKPRKELDAQAAQAIAVSVNKANLTNPVFSYAKAVLKPETLATIRQREGGAAFLKAFFSDRTWMEDFFGSGPAKPSWDTCLLMLDELAWQVPLTNRALKKWATAAALNASESNRDAVLRLFVTFVEVRARKLLARGAEDLPVGMLRYVLTPAQVTAEELAWLAKTHNVPPRAYSGVCWYAPYRTFNFFGDSVQGPHYYVSWEHVYNRREAARKVGGVCGALSYYGSLAAKAHGLPSTPGGQPAHCAYPFFVPSENYWWICYNVHPYTGAHYQMWHYSFDYLPLAADTFFAEKRLETLRLFWQAEVKRLRKYPQPEISPMTCRIYPNWKAKTLPAANQMPELLRVDEGVTTFDVNQAGNGIRDYVVLVWEGTIKVPKTCQVELSLTSDDGSELILDGKQVIDNNGSHGMVNKAANLTLTAGEHPFTLRYFNYDGGRGLDFKVTARYPYDAKVMAGYAQALKHAPGSYDILDAWEKELTLALDVPITAWEAFIEAAAQGLAAHPRPAWDLLSRHALSLVGQVRGKDALAKLMARLHGVIRQDDRLVSEFCDFSAVLDNLAKLLETDEQRFTFFRGALAGQVGTKDAFGIVMHWGGKHFLGQAEQAKRYVAIVGEVLREAGDSADVGKFVDGAIREAANAGNLTAFQSLNDLREALVKGTPRKALDLSFTQAPLLSDKGLLRLSTTSNWDQPGNYRAVIDGKEAVGNFHTASESAPWVEVELPGMAEVSAVYIENVHTQNNGRAVPFKVEVSEDAKRWKQVAKADRSQDEWKLTFAPVKGRFVRVTWTGGEGKKTFLHFRKVTVHGKKLY